MYSVDVKIKVGKGDFYKRHFPAVDVSLETIVVYAMKHLSPEFEHIEMRKITGKIRMTVDIFSYKKEVS